MKDIKGSLNKLYDNKIIQEYIEEYGGAFGYLGNDNRTKEIDLVLESLLTNEHAMKLFSEDYIAEWMCSRPARHFMDVCNNIKYFKNNILDSVLEVKELIKKEKLL